MPLEPAQCKPLPRSSSLSARPPALPVRLPEHILAALLVLDIDDCCLRFFGGEPPILDGSALPFAAGLRAAGISGRPATRQLRIELTWKGQSISWQGDSRVLAARTFIDRAEARQLGGQSFFRGARPGCALIVDASTSLYGGRPRVCKEPLHHKLLDLLGDLGPFRARGSLSGLIRCNRPTHAHNQQTIQSALASGELRWLRTPP